MQSDQFRIHETYINIVHCLPNDKLELHKPLFNIGFEFLNYGLHFSLYKFLGVGKNSLEHLVNLRLVQLVSITWEQVRQLPHTTFTEKLVQILNHFQGKPAACACFGSIKVWQVNPFLRRCMKKKMNMEYPVIVYSL